MLTYDAYLQRMGGDAKEVSPCTNDIVTTSPTLPSWAADILDEEPTMLPT